MKDWTLFFGVILGIALIVLLVDRRKRLHEAMYAKRMRGSALYYEISSLITQARMYELDRVRIERSRIEFYSVYPPGKIGAYVLADHGHRPLNAQRTLALVHALMQDVPVLQESRCYRLKRYTVTRPNGIKDYGYQFTIRSQYKTRIMYAQEGRWIG